jgi:predicted nuclease of predicted toxin-antitoxin system
MKLLLDQNLSRKLVPQIETLYPGSVHITSVLPEDAEDRDIWLYAKENGFTIVTKDDDFEQRSILLGSPPKVIWIRLGTCRTAEVSAVLINSNQVIEAFGRDEEKALMAIP